jgi:DNA-binding phage protein
MRMLRETGNPRASSLAAILKAIGRCAGVHIAVHAEPVAELERA